MHFIQLIAFTGVTLLRFVMSVLETGSDPLEGDEVGRIIKFKCTLGIDDPDAAKVHMEVPLAWSSFLLLELLS